MQLMRKPLRWISVVLCLCLLLAGCAPAAEESSSQAASSTPASSETSESAAASSEAQTASAGKADKTTLVYGLNTEPGKLDPQNNSVLSGMVVAKQIYEPLIDKDPETGEFVPRLATEWEWVDDTHLRMKLRDDVTFHDGTPFTAEDVKFTIGRFPDGAATGSLFSAFDPENTVVEDDYTITIAFKFACAPALNFLTNGRAYIVSKDYVEANGEESLNQSGMGTGPYAFKEWVIGSHLMLTRYNDYWGGAPAIENLTVRFIVEDSARMVALETGEIDIGSELQAVDIERIMNGEVPGVVGYTSPPTRSGISASTRTSSRSRSGRSVSPSPTRSTGNRPVRPPAARPSCRPTAPWPRRSSAMNPRGSTNMTPSFPNSCWPKRAIPTALRSPTSPPRCRSTSG